MSEFGVSRSHSTVINVAHVLFRDFRLTTRAQNVIVISDDDNYSPLAPDGGQEDEVQIIEMREQRDRATSSPLMPLPEDLPVSSIRLIEIQAVTDLDS